MASGWENNSTYSTFSWVNNCLKNLGPRRNNLKWGRGIKQIKYVSLFCASITQETGVWKSSISVWNAKQKKIPSMVSPLLLELLLCPLRVNASYISRESHCWVSYLWLLLLELCKSQKNLICVEVGKNILVGERFSRVSQCFDVITEFKTKN